MPKGKFVDISFVGGKELQRRLNRLALKDSKKVVRQAMREAAQPILQRVKFLVPKGDTGELLRSIKLRALPRSRTRFGVRIIAGGTRMRKGKTVGNSGYASFVELGSQHQKAQSFIRQAKDDGAAQFDRDAEKLIGAGIERAARKK